MTPDESPPLFVSRGGHRCLSSDPLRTIVWLRGEHDAATRGNLSVTLAQAVDLADADVVVDLSGVTFMDASTIGALVDAGNRLRACSRSLCVRDPPLRARRLLGLCKLERLIDEHAAPAPAPAPVATALGSWVEVPAQDRVPDSAPLPPVSREAPSPEPVCVMAQRELEPARSIHQRRAPS